MPERKQPNIHACLRRDNHALKTRANAIQHQLSYLAPISDSSCGSPLTGKLTRLHSRVLPFLRGQVRFSEAQLFSKLRRRPCRPYHWTPLPWGNMSTPETKPGFLSAGITALSPWGSRSATPKPPPPSSHHGDEDKAAGPGAGAQRGGDHVVNRRPRLSLRKYPSDCPPLVVRWFHAVDVCVSSILAIDSNMNHLDPEEEAVLSKSIARS